jgi:putative ubiquitin-RnfH superfamily antitoxin RatB of RatAB toxin-antitoxin module
MKKLLAISLFAVLGVALFFKSSIFAGINSQQLTRLYKSMGDELTDLRKKNPGIESKIYLLLDQVDRIYNISKNVIQTKRAYKDRVKTKKQENGILQNEIFNLKNELDVAKNELGIFNKKLEETKVSLDNEKIKAEGLSKEKKILEEQMVQMEVIEPAKKDPQKEEINLAKHIMPSLKKGHHLTEEELYKNENLHSLNLTSTSDPRSPR